VIDLLELNPASLQCQRWRDGQHSWRHVSEGGFDHRRYVVEPIDERPAKEFVVAQHYSRSYPAASRRFGLFTGGDLVGVAVFGVPMQYRVLTLCFPELTPVTEALELSRFVLLDEVPANAESWFLARCFEQLAAVGLAGIVSFSDPVPRIANGVVVMPGHRGTVYQASNAVYTGRGAPATKIVLPDGTTLSNRSMSKVRGSEVGAEYVIDRLVGFGARRPRPMESPHGWLRDALTDVGAHRIRHRGNFRYAFRLGSKAQRRHVRIAPAPLPYPKEIDAA
jgi:hypothetical protein